MTGNPERGGAAILVAFLLLTLMAAVGFATSRNLTRELAMGGEAVQGSLAAAAAEAGLAWFLAQASEDPGGVAGVQPGSAAPEGLLAERSDSPQSFELRIRNLGARPRPGDEAEEATEQLWWVTAVGRSTPGGLGQPGFIQVRELLVAEARDRPGALRVLAWTAPARWP